MQGQNNHQTLDALASSRIPPAWSPEHERSYPFRTWEGDLRLWYGATDIDEVRRGPTVALRIGGAAKLILRELPIAHLAQGRQERDAHGNNS